MSQFLYFVPEPAKTQLKLDDVRELGLGYAFDAAPSPRGVHVGPDGRRGAVLSASDERLGFAATQQKWRRIPDSELWCGFWTDDAPTPADVQRQILIDGEWLLFDDGNRWCAPIARRFEEYEGLLLPYCALPKTLDLDDNGELIAGQVKPRFRRLWELFLEYDAVYMKAAEEAISLSKDTFTIDCPNANELVVEALQQNYRVGLVELVLLGVLDTSMRTAVLDTLADRSAQIAFAKKKMAQALSEGNGTTDFSSGPKASEREMDTSTPPLQPICTG